MKKLSEPADYYKYDAIIRDIDDMIEYFDRMADSMARIEDEANQLSRKIGEMIEAGTGQTRRRVSDAIML